jgi:hypothetical protein
VHSVPGIWQIQPKVVPRECGGWLATTPDVAPVRVGVTGETENAAREAFAISLGRWKSLVQEDDAAGLSRGI